MKVIILTDYNDYGGVANTSTSLYNILSKKGIYVEKIPIYCESNKKYIIQLIKSICKIKKSNIKKVILKK